MNPPSHLLIRADAGGILGTGHVMRMIALAQAWQDRGGSVTLAACQCPASLLDRLAKEQISFAAIEARLLGGNEDLADTIRIGKSLRAEWIVTDGYHFNENYHKGLQAESFKLLAVDDYGHCEAWHADVVINQNLRNAAEDVKHLAVIPNCRFLNGPRYALLRREFRKSAHHAKVPEKNALRILVTFGGVDPNAATLKIIRALHGLIAAPLDLKVLAGHANPNLDAIRLEVAKSPHRIELIPACDNMPSLYQWAERVISAGGSSCYEWMYFGLPGWVTSIADNQDEIVIAMLSEKHADGVKRIDSIPEDLLAQSLARWIDSPQIPKTRLVDGWGALRVAAAIAPFPCWVRPVEETSDSEFLFELANEPSVRDAGCHPANIQWNEHLAWLKHHCHSEQSRLMVVEMDNQGPVGQIRFHQRHERFWEIGIAIHPAHRLSGLATTALSLAIRELSTTLSVTGFLARIRKTNQASQRLFAKIGFALESEEADMQSWILTDPAI